MPKPLDKFVTPQQKNVLIDYLLEGNDPQDLAEMILELMTKRELRELATEVRDAAAETAQKEATP